MEQLHLVRVGCESAELIWKMHISALSKITAYKKAMLRTTAWLLLYSSLRNASTALHAWSK